MGNSFLEPAYQGMSGMLRSLVTSSLDRTNEANRAVCEYLPCSVNAFFDSAHSVDSTIISGGDKRLRTEAIRAQVQASISNHIPVIILHEGDYHLEHILRQNFSSGNRYREVGTSSPCFEPFYGLTSLEIARETLETAPKDYELKSNSQFYIEALCSYLGYAGRHTSFKMLSTCPHAQMFDKVDDLERQGVISSSTSQELKAKLMMGQTECYKLNNLDEDSFVYVKGNFEPIVSESLWHECERIRKSRISSLRLPDGETRRKGTKTTKNLWVSKLRCRCGSSYRIFKWRKLKDGTPVFGYQCNMRTVNPTRSFVLEHSLTDQLSCDAISVPEWKLDLMAKKIFEKVWGNQNKAILLACQMIEGCKSGKPTTLISAAPIQSKIEKIKNRKMNYAAMRADGELGREEYQALCKQADDEINRLEQDLKSIAPEPDSAAVSANMKALHDFLEQKLDVRGACLAPELIEQFVEVVTPISDYTYRWKLNTGSKKEKHERADLMAVTGKPVLTFTIDFETAKKYREANKMPHQFRRAAWSDLTVEVYL